MSSARAPLQYARPAYVQGTVDSLVGSNFSPLLDETKNAWWTGLKRLVKVAPCPKCLSLVTQVIFNNKPYRKYSLTAVIASSCVSLVRSCEGGYHFC